MAFGWSRTRVSPIAIDFGSEWLKVLQIAPGDPPQLVAAAAAQVPEEARHDAAERQRFLSRALGEALKYQPFKGRRVICSLPAFQTLVQNFEIGRAEPHEIGSLVADQLRQRMNLDPQRMVIRHYDVGQIVRNGSTLQHVLCMAAGRDVVMRYIDLCSQSKLDVVGMHSEPTALLRAFHPNARHGRPAANGHADADAGADAQPAVCYIDIGSSTTKLAITHGASIVFAKTIEADASRLGTAPAARQSAPAERAGELAAESAGATPAGGEGGLAMLNAATAQENAPDVPGGTDAPVAPKAADDTLECLIDELQMCLRYHQGLFPQKAVERLVFLGGAARHVQTCQRIAQVVRIAAQLGDPLATLTRPVAANAAAGVDLEQPQPGWAVPFGLCHCEANL